MKIKLIVIGKTDDKSLQLWIEKYESRVNRYVSFSIEIIPDLKKTRSLSELEQKNKEGQLILSRLSSSDQVFLLDEKGKQYNSVEFSSFLQKQMNSGLKQLVFVIGGPYGFSESIYQKAVGQISLSKMTFSHQMVRLFATEQLYRAFSILNNEPYHHQ